MLKGETFSFFSSYELAAAGARDGDLRGKPLRREREEIRGISPVALNQLICFDRGLYDSLHQEKGKYQVQRAESVRPVKGKNHGGSFHRAAGMEWSRCE